MRSIRTVAAVLFSLLLISSCAAKSTAVPAGQATSGPAAGQGDATCAYPASADPAAKSVTPPPGTEPNTGTVAATLNLTDGIVEITMDRSKTPCTIGSFVHLATSGYFNNTPCHRLTTTAGLRVLQCGDPSGTGTGGPGYTFDDETSSSMTYPAGTVAMANSGPNTNGSQFFLVYADSQLPPLYTVFGKVTGGLDVLTKIAAAGVKGGDDDGAPASPVTISKVSVTS